MQKVSKETATQIAVKHIKRQKRPEKIDIAAVEEKDDCWVIRGTCPIDMAGHPWAERFEVAIDPKGQVKSAEFALL